MVGCFVQCDQIVKVAERDHHHEFHFEMSGKRKRDAVASFKERKEHPTTSLTETELVELRDSLLCPICHDVPAIAAPLLCKGNHVVCLPCLISLRFHSYKICQSNFEAHVELDLERSDKCPVCREEVDLQYLPIAESHDQKLKLYEQYCAEYRKARIDYRLCQCNSNTHPINTPSLRSTAARRNRSDEQEHQQPQQQQQQFVQSHNGHLMQQLRCSTCTVECPFDSSCIITSHLIRCEPELLSNHLLQCKGFTNCSYCGSSISNPQLDIHLKQHQSWLKFSREMRQLPALLDLDMLQVQCMQPNVQSRIARYWRLFETVVFRELSGVDHAPRVDSALQSIEEILNMARFPFPGVGNLINSIQESEPEAMTEVVADYVTDLGSMFGDNQ